MAKIFANDCTNFTLAPEPCFEIGINYHGETYDTALTDSVYACQAVCQADPKCAFFMYLGEWTKYCALKEDYVAKEALETAVSGPKYC